MRQILLDVFEDNPAAMHIYKSLGFVCTGTNDITLRDLEENPATLRA